MNLPSVPPSIKGSINAAGKEVANIGQNTARSYTQATKGFQNVGAQIRSNVKAGQASPQARSAGYSINPVKGTGKAFMSAFKKAKKK